MNEDPWADDVADSADSGDVEAVVSTDGDDPESEAGDAEFGEDDDGFGADVAEIAADEAGEDSHAEGEGLNKPQDAHVVESADQPDGVAPTEAEPVAAAEPEPSEADVMADELEGDLVGVDDALKRLDDGTYGTCTSCGADLADSALEENPTTSVCQPQCAKPPATESASVA